MLSRVISQVPRQRSFHTASRLAFAQCQIHPSRYGRERLGGDPSFKAPSESKNSRSYDKEPLRPVQQRSTENITERSLPSDSIPSPSPAQPFQPRAGNFTRPTPPPSPQSSRIDGNELPDSATANTQPELEPEPQTPLPDLTQGIPSTIDAELLQARGKVGTSRDGFNITEDARDPQSPDAADRGGDGLPRSSYVSSSDRRRSFLTRYFYLSVIVGGVLYGVYMGRNWDPEEADQLQNDIPNGYTPGLIYTRAMARWGSTMSYYKDPVTKKLLPDVGLVDPNMPPYTLVLGLEDVLVHSEWTREHGWRIAKRPGLDYFLRYLHSYYEVAIFSGQPEFTVAQIRKKIDPYSMVHVLSREMTSYEDGAYVKDLSYLNRDLKKVVVVDADPQALKKQPENAIILPPWTGDPKDTALIDLIPFLENLASLGYDDTREVLKSFEGKDIAQEFDRRQKLLREKWESQQAEKRKTRKSGGYSLGSIFGSKSKPQPGQPALGDTEGKMYTDIIRERGQEMYKMLDNHLRTEGPKMLAEQEAMEKKMQEEAMASMKSGMFGWFSPAKKDENQ